MKTINDYAELVKEKHALNKTIAPVETDLTDASRGYHIGEQFIYDGELNKAKAEIAQHDALVLNTNYEPADDLTTQIKNAGGTTDPRLDVFENNIAPVETDETDASKAYQVGEQLILSNILYDVIAPISEHDVITTTGSGANISPAGSISSGIQTLTNQVSSLNSAIANKANTSDVNTALSGKENTPTVLTATLAAGSTTLTFTDASVGNNSRIRAYSDPFVLGLIADMSQSGTTVTLTCVAQASAVSVKLEVRN